LTVCAICKEDLLENENFCTSCGASISQIKKSENSTNKLNESTQKGVLVLPDNSKIMIDESHRLVGRVDLRKFSNNDPSAISRGHFTVYAENGKYYLHDGTTNVQEKSSGNHTYLNGEDITKKGRTEITDNSSIQVSDVLINFKFE